MENNEEVVDDQIIEDEMAVEIDGEEIDDLVFDSLDEMIEFEVDTHAEGERMLDISHSAYEFISEDLKQELYDRAMEVVGILNPDLAKEIEEGELFIFDRNPREISFAVCMGDGEDETEHQHEAVVSIPMVALNTDEDGWKEFIKHVKYLSDSGLVEFLYE